MLWKQKIVQNQKLWMLKMFRLNMPQAHPHRQFLFVNTICSASGFINSKISACFCFLSSGAERTPAELCGGDQRSTRPGIHQGGPPWQAGRTDQVQSQRVEGRLCSRRCFVWCTCGVQHWMVSIWFQFALDQLQYTDSTASPLCFSVDFFMSCMFYKTCYRIFHSRFCFLNSQWAVCFGGVP